MDQRLVSTSAVRCVGNTLMLQGRVYSPPFVIIAVGDPAAMPTRSTTTPPCRSTASTSSSYGLGYLVRSESR